jgi:ferredoxin, 2Fe-2S
MRITFLLPDGTARDLDAAGQPTAMHVAVRNDLPGLLAECGGQCICVTCMVEVDPAWRMRIPPAGEDETDMLADTLGVVPEGRRLSCQIRLDPDLDGLTLRIPPAQP